MIFGALSNCSLFALPTIAKELVVAFYTHKGDSKNKQKIFRYRLYPNSWKSDNFRESNQEKKQRTDIKKAKKK